MSSATASSVRHAVFPVAGLGTRFLPATKAQPKEMLPLVDRPAIQYVVEEAVASGIRHITLVTARGKGSIEDHFDMSPELERHLERRSDNDTLEVVKNVTAMASFSAVRQHQALGLGHAVLTARDTVGHQPFAVFLSDDVIHAAEPCMAQLLAVHAEKGGCVIAVEEVERERVSSYGVVDAEEVGDGVYRVRDLVEKPPVDEAPSNLAIIGRYVLAPEIFAHLERTAPDHKGEIQLTNGLRALCKEMPIHVVRFSGKRYDTGNKLGFLQATVEYALRRDDLGAAFASYLQELDIEGARNG